MVQIYYGDETARDLTIANTKGDAKLRGVMNWTDILEMKGPKTYYSIGEKWDNSAKTSMHRKWYSQTITSIPYLFTRHLENQWHKDDVIIGLDFLKGKKSLKFLITSMMASRS